MKKQKSLNNKGFSLVELIIVIAIMAILVGVLAPQLIRYVEKTRVSSDTQFADSVKTAVTTAMMDPTVLEDSGSKTDISNLKTGSELKDILVASTDTSASKFKKAVSETLGYDGSGAEAWIQSKLKSDGASSGSVVINSDGNDCIVAITNTHKNGKDTTDGVIYVGGKTGTASVSGTEITITSTSSSSGDSGSGTSGDS